MRLHGEVLCDSGAAFVGFVFRLGQSRELSPAGKTTGFSCGPCGRCSQSWQPPLPAWLDL